MALRSVASIVCSNDFTVYINNDHNVLSFGTSTRGAHGHEEDNVFPPKIISSLNHIISISTYGYHSICLDNNGNVYAFGNNLRGQLGFDADEPFISIPKKVNLPPCTQISCGSTFTMCLSENGEVYSFGNNEQGQLGVGNNEESYNSPQLISSLKDVEFIECGSEHTFCKTLNNEIYSWGVNISGQLGLENNDNQNTPILCSSLSNEDVIDIKCGYEHTLVLTSNGDVLSCGNNRSGQLGRDTDREHSASFKKLDIFEITRIACGGCHSMLLDANNDIYMFGSNLHGELGIGYTDGDDYRPMIHPSLSNIIDVSHGGSSTFVKTSNNEIYAFGNNTRSQLGFYKKSGIQFMPKHVFQGSENIWYTNLNKKSNQKSARSFK